MIGFTKHAKEKFAILERHGFSVTEEFVRNAVLRPQKVDHSRSPLIIAQVVFDAHRVLRVVYRQEGEVKKVITFYPGRKSQYEKR